MEDIVSYKPLIEDMTWSYSRLKTFEDCNYRWYLKYIFFMGKNVGKELFFSGYGKFLHELIANFHSGKMSKIEVQNEYLYRFKDVVCGAPPSVKVFENYFIDGLDYLKSICITDNNIIGVEQKFDFNIFGVPFVGYVDRIESDKDGNIIIIDEKSRNLKKRSIKGRVTKSDLELDKYLIQLYLYSIPIIESYNVAPNLLCFNCFRKNEFIVEPFRENKYHDAKLWAKDTVEKILIENEFKPSLEYFQCRYICDMQDYCEYYELSRRR